MSASSSEIRAWARANGYDVPDRGVLPSAIVTIYEAAHGDPTPHVEVEGVPVLTIGPSIEVTTVGFEVPGTCRFEIGGIEYEVPMSIPVTWTPGGAA